jgi:prevent-host-death family protein
MDASSTARIQEVLETKYSDVLNDHAFLNLRDARVKFSKLVNAARINANKIVITNHGEPAAAIVPIGALRILDLFEKAGLELPDVKYRDLTKEDAIRIIKKLGMQAETEMEADDGELNKTPSG